MAADAHLYERYKVDVPEGERDGMAVHRFQITEHGPDNLRLLLHGRPPNPPGWYTRLGDAHGVWMSDVAEEIEDHVPAFRAMFWARDGARVLIHGLGLGLVLQQALRMANVAHVDVVEIDPRVIALVGPHYEAMARANGKRLHIHAGDAFTFRWRPHQYWNVVWHDIWRSYTEDNLPEMARLHRKFGTRSGWQGSWGRGKCRRIRDGTYQRAHAEIVARFHASIGLTPEMEARLRAQTQMHAERMEGVLHG